MEPDTDDLATVDSDTVERTFAPPSRSAGSAYVSQAGIRLAKLLGVFAVLGLVAVTVWGVAATPGGGAESTVARAEGASSDGEAADADVSDPDPLDWADGPVEGDSVLAGTYRAATEASSLSNGDRAYCSEGGKVVHVGATLTYRGALCTNDGQLVYHGLSKNDDGRVTLPARIEGETVVATGDDGYTYTMTEDSLEIRQNGSLVAEEEMGGGRPPPHAELDLPGDLNLSRPITYPACDGSIAVIAGSVYEPATTVAQLQGLLDQHPEAEYLRTDLSCDNFRGPSSDNSGGFYIYAVYYEMDESQQGEACALADEVGGYADWMRDGVDPLGRVECA